MAELHRYRALRAAATPASPWGLTAVVDARLRLMWKERPWGALQSTRQGGEPFDDGRSQSKYYNELLFGRRGLRRSFHLARFTWAEEAVARLGRRPVRLIEIGCYDGRLLERVRPYTSDYVGIDANWGGGLDQARERFGRLANVRFIEASEPAELAAFGDRSFDAAVALETLEHVPPASLPGFLDQLARVTDGDLFITVPNETGIVFLVKYLLKRLRYGGADQYSFAEFVAAVLGRTERISRHEHKGFSHWAFVRQLAEQFDIVSVSGLPRLGLPPSLSFTVAIHARSRRRSGA